MKRLLLIAFIFLLGHSCISTQKNFDKNILNNSINLKINEIESNLFLAQLKILDKGIRVNESSGAAIKIIMYKYVVNFAESLDYKLCALIAENKKGFTFLFDKSNDKSAFLLKLKKYSNNADDNSILEIKQFQKEFEMFKKRYNLESEFL